MEDRQKQKVSQGFKDKATDVTGLAKVTDVGLQANLITARPQGLIYKVKKKIEAMATGSDES